MLDIKAYASGSKGNLYTLSNGESTVMLDCGLPFREIQRLTGFNLPDYVLVTHEHKDHCKGLDELLRRGVIGYMTIGTARALDARHNVVFMEYAVPHYVPQGITICAFQTQHDAVEPCGFLIEDKDDKVLYATDTYYIKYKFSGLTKIMIEANYSYEILEENVRNGVLDERLAKRLIKSHFGLENVLSFLAANDLSRLKEVWLIHLSDSNSDAQLFKRKVMEATGKPVYIAGRADNG